MPACRPTNVEFDWTTDGQVTVTWDMENESCENQSHGVAVYSYEDTGPAAWDASKPQTLIDHDTSFALADETVTLSLDDACGVDLQVDLFRGQVIDDVPTRTYGNRLVAADHEDGPECVTESTTTTSTTIDTSTTTSTSTTSTTVEDEEDEVVTTTTSSTTSTSPLPTTNPTPTTQPITCEQYGWRDVPVVDARGYMDSYKVLLDTDKDGIACESGAFAPSNVTDPAPTSYSTETSQAQPTGTLPHTGSDLAVAELGALVLLPGVVLTTLWFRLRRGLRHATVEV